jgi:hypothetical protein
MQLLSGALVLIGDKKIWRQKSGEIRARCAFIKEHGNGAVIVVHKMKSLFLVEREKRTGIKICFR